MTEPLTERQEKILAFIKKSIQEQGYPPTIREIGEHFGIRSTNGVNDHLKALERKGYLMRGELESRSWRRRTSPITSASTAFWSATAGEKCSRCASPATR